jgi:crotonobetainyl-CoA:carnitine CoA-transferase CaiB-like acyl-CoA transferase
MSKPLSGIRVMDLGSFLAAPYSTAILASLGADVIKVEPLPPGEPFRRGRGTADEYFVQYNTGKKSISVDLKNPSGRVVVDRLLETCDVLVHSLRPGKPEKLDLGFEQLAPRFPELVYAAVSGFGNVGELSHRPGYDSAAESLSGLYSLLAPEGSFQAGGLPLADTSTGIVTALGVCTALARRARTGVGGLVETSLFEVATMLATEGMVHPIDRRNPDARDTEWGPSSTPPYSARSQIYCITSADEVPIMLALGDSEQHWSELTRLLSTPTALSQLGDLSYCDRVRDHRAVGEALQQTLTCVDSANLLDLLGRRGIPATRIRSYQESITGTGAASTVLQEMPGQIDLVRPGFRINGEWPDRVPRVPRIGEDTRELLTELGLGNEIERLLADEAIHCAPGRDRDDAVSP